MGGGEGEELVCKMNNIKRVPGLPLLIKVKAGTSRTL